MLSRLFPKGGRKRSAFILTLANLFSYVLTNLAGLAVVRMVSPEDYAVKVLAFSIVNFFVAFADMGIQFALLKQVGGAKSQREQVSFLARAVGINAFSVAVFYWGALFLVFMPVGRLYGLSDPFFLVSLSFAFSVKQVSALLFSYSAGRGQFKRLSIAIGVSAVFYSALVIALVAFLGIYGVFWAMILAAIFDAVLKAAIVEVPFGAFFSELKTFSFSGKRERSLVYTGIFFMASIWFSAALQNYDNLVLGAFHPKEFVSYYAVAYLPLFPMLVAANSIFSASLPGISFLKEKERGRVFLKSMKYSTLACLGIAGGAIPAYFVLTSLFLEKYALSARLLPLLAVPFAIEAGINNTSVNFLIGFGRNFRALALRGVQLFVSFVSGFFLIRAFGIYGAVASVWISASSGAVLSYFLCKGAQKK